MHFCISLKWNSFGSIFVLLTIKNIILVYTLRIFKNDTRFRTDFSILKILWHSQSYKSFRFTGGRKNSSKVPDLRKTKNSFEINGGFQVRLCKLKFEHYKPVVDKSLDLRLPHNVFMVN